MVCDRVRAWGGWICSARLPAFRPTVQVEHVGDLADVGVLARPAPAVKWAAVPGASFARPPYRMPYRASYIELGLSVRRGCPAQSSAQGRVSGAGASGRSSVRSRVERVGRVPRRLPVNRRLGACGGAPVPCLLSAPPPISPTTSSPRRRSDHRRPRRQDAGAPGHPRRCSAGTVSEGGAARFSAYGSAVVGGPDLLVHRAVLKVEHMSGHPPARCPPPRPPAGPAYGSPRGRGRIGDGGPGPRTGSAVAVREKAYGRQHQSASI